MNVISNILLRLRVLADAIAPDAVADIVEPDGPFTNYASIFMIIIAATIGVLVVFALIVVVVKIVKNKEKKDQNNQNKLG